MYNFLRAFLICIVTYGTIFQLNAQTEYESISNEDIFEHKHLKPLEILDIFKARYQKSLQEQNEASQFELAKYIAHASYRASKTSEIDYWLAKVDSLGKIVAPEKYDKSLEFLKITWAHANKQTAKAMTLLEKMKPYAEMTEDTIWKIDYHIKMVNTYSSFDDQAVALKNLFEAETLNSKFKGRLQEALILDSKSAIEWEKRDHQKSLNYELQACNIFEELDYKNNLAAVYSNIIAKATTIGNTKIADQFMQKLNKHHKKMGCQTCFLTGEMNRIYFYITQAKYREALALADTLTIFADTMNREKSHIVYLQGVAYRGLDQYDKAEKYIEHAFNLGKEINHIGKCAFYSHALYETYYWKDKFEPALRWYKTYTSYQDSVYNEKKAKEIAVFEARLESLEQSKKVTELEAKAKIEKQKKQGLWLLIILGGLLALSLLYAQGQRARKKQAVQDGLLIKANIERDKLEQQLEFKQKELASQILNLTQKNTLLQNLKLQIESLKNEKNGQSVSKLIKTIQQNVENSDEWDQFLQTFKSIHSSFLMKLHAMSENLTSGEIRIASLMKMNLSSKEIATMLNITDDGVKKARYRLRKKLGLESDINIQDYLLSLD